MIDNLDAIICKRIDNERLTCLNSYLLYWGGGQVQPNQPFLADVCLTSVK